MASAWGTDKLTTRHSICNPLGEGHFVDRATFDQEMLAGLAVNYTQLTGVSRYVTHWILEFINQPTAQARFVVDASGRSAVFAKMIRVKRHALDPLVALTTRVVAHDCPSGEALVESAEAGWWFSAPTTNGALAVTWFGYQDRLPLAEALRATVHTARRVRQLSTQAPISRSARTEWLSQAAGSGWLAIGDAAFASDPLGSQGLWRALEAAKPAAQLILNGSARQSAAIRIYSDYVSQRVKLFLRERRSYYRMEQRWSASPFWKIVHAASDLELSHA